MKMRERTDGKSQARGEIAKLAGSHGNIYL